MADSKPMTEARKAANKKWNDANLKDKYDRIQLVVPKGEKATIKAAADQAGLSVNAYIYNAVCTQMKCDGLTVSPDSTMGGIFHNSSTENISTGE